MKMLLAVVVIAMVVFYFYTQSQNSEQAKQNLAQGTAFLAENKTKEGVITTPTGLQYKVLHKGDGTVHPKASDTVKVHYHGTLIDGNRF